MTTEQATIDFDGLRTATRKGLVATAILAVLTIVEFLIAINVENPLLPLLPFVVLKGWIILDAFMHIRAVFGEDGH
ncbi:MAG: hypothetical protein ACC683_05365 [Acidimicrobiia bacterium]